MDGGTNRRRFLRRAVAAAAGTAAGMSLEEKALLAGRRATDPSPPASAPTAAGTVPEGTLPTGKLGDRNVSRIICGGNLISGFAHSRDLTYVSPLLKNYFTDEKVFETLHLCEQHGVNTALLRCDDHVIGLLDRYWKKEGGKIQWLAQTYPSSSGKQDNIQKAIDGGAMACYLQGGFGDRWVTQGKVDLLEKAVEYIHDRKMPAGIGGHMIAVPIAVEEAGIEPDFYMKTLHRTDYWSYTKERVCDNTWSATPEETARFMETVKRPWIAFKVLAAGSVHPRKGFRYAFEKGADFACVGMFDFQVAEDCRIARQILSGTLNRKRPWRA
ncbi:MAG: hypothetical protein R6X20_18955 [Phycisphaerae bacterium]